MGVIDEHLREDMAPGDSGAAEDARAVAAKANALGDLVTSGRLSETELNATFGAVTLITEFGAVGNGVADDSAAFAAALAAVPSGGTLQLPRGSYVLPDVTVTRSDVNIVGPGTVIGRITFGSAGTTTDFKGRGVFGVRFERSGPTGSLSFAAIRWINVKRHVIAGNWFYNMSSAIYSATEAGQDCADNIVRDNFYDNVNHFFRGVTGSGAVWRSHADLTFTGNTGKARITHIKIDSCDGLKVRGNRLFFFGFAAADGTKERHIEVGYSDWVMITDNELFEAGLESIYLTDPNHFTIAENLIAWPSQRAAVDAIAITLGIGRAGDATAPARTFTVGEISGGVISQWSKSAIGFYGTGNVGNVVIKPLALERASGNPPSYYGGGTLATPTRVSLAGTLTAIPPRLPEYSGEMLGTMFDDFRGRTTATERWIHPRAKEIALPNRDATITGATTLYIIRDLNQQSTATTAVSGRISLDMRNAGTLAKTASYELQITQSPDGTRTCEVMGKGGRTAGAAANDPSFTFTVEHNGTNIVLRATPVGSTSGAFSYSAYASGNMILG